MQNNSSQTPILVQCREQLNNRIQRVQNTLENNQKSLKKNNIAALICGALYLLTVSGSLLVSQELDWILLAFQVSSFAFTLPIFAISHNIYTKRQDILSNQEELTRQQSSFVDNMRVLIVGHLNNDFQKDTAFQGSENINARSAIMSQLTQKETKETFDNIANLYKTNRWTDRVPTIYTPQNHVLESCDLRREIISNFLNVDALNTKQTLMAYKILDDFFMKIVSEATIVQTSEEHSNNDNIATQTGDEENQIPPANNQRKPDPSPHNLSRTHDTQVVPFEEPLSGRSSA